MATRTPPQSPYRQSSGGSYGASSGSVDVGSDAIARMAREDTRWFIVAVVVLSLVLFLALPLSVLIYVDTLKMQAEVRREVRQMKREKKESQDVANRHGDSGELNQQRDAQSSRPSD